jgi:LacI family transcriptional regulator
MSSPTVRSLAKQAGLSAATVSLALRNHPRISTAVRERVRLLAEKSGYEANPAVSKLLSQIRGSSAATYRGTIAIVYTPSHLEDARVAAVREWTDAVRRRASELGFGIDEFYLYEKGMTASRLAQILHARGIQGLLVTGPFGGQRVPRELDILWERSSAIVLGERPVSPALSCVLNNQFETAAEAMRRVIKLGYRRPGLCIHPYVDEVAEHRFTGGFLVVQAQLPKAERVPALDYSSQGRAAFLRWIDRYQPDVVLTLHPEVRFWATSSGRKVPRDLGLVHLDRTDDIGDWAGMHQDSKSLGFAAVEILLGQVYFNVLGTPPFQQSLLVGSNWVDGGTVRKLKAGARRQARG